MDFWLTDDQRNLQDAMRSFVQGRFPLAEIAQAEGKDRVIKCWEDLAGMGIFSMRADGLGAREAVLVYEELGRGLVPGPLVASHLAAGLVGGAANGSTIVGLYEPGTEVTFVEHAAETTSLLWFDGGDLRVVDTTALTLEPVARPLDPLSPVWRATGEEPLAPVIATGAEAARLQHLGVVLAAAQLLGVALGATELATTYAGQRQQFGRPIGSFQAVKHLLADMLTKAELARAQVYAAACALDGASADDPARAAAAAKVTAGDAALFCGKTGIQVHGGMGFTWEVHAQRYWKRAVVLDATFGSADHHARELAGLM
ncbi:MAG TPA: acyl-CoA dehydrogenase family protein [Jatrophihabitantaceae bacterium]|nr:acyl-CoA dehydrogenase family protein [Jatrophihabitantaceae bacterium]